MIKAIFRHRDSCIVDMFAFPNRPHGINRGGKRPYRVEISGLYENENIAMLKKWVYGDITRSLAPKDRKVVVSIEGLPFVVDSTP